MHRHDKRKTAQPTPLFDCISTSRCAAGAQMHPIAHCTIPVRTRPLPCRSAPVWMQSCYSAVPPRSEATRCTAVSPRLTAARRPVVPALYGHKLVTLLYRFCSHILHFPAASLADHPLPPIPPVWVQPRSPAVQLHSDAPTASLCRCCSQAAPVALPYRNRPAVPSLFEYSPLLFHAVLLKGNSCLLYTSPSPRD